VTCYGDLVGWTIAEVSPYDPLRRMQSPAAEWPYYAAVRART